MQNVYSNTPKKFSDYLATYGLWLSTAVLSVYQITVVWEIVLSLHAWLNVLSGRNLQLRAAFESVAIGQPVIIGMALVAIVIIIGGFE